MVDDSVLCSFRHASPRKQGGWEQSMYVRMAWIVEVLLRRIQHARPAMKEGEWGGSLVGGYEREGRGVTCTLDRSRRGSRRFLRGTNGVCSSFPRTGRRRGGVFGAAVWCWRIQRGQPYRWIVKVSLKVCTKHVIVPHVSNDTPFRLPDHDSNSDFLLALMTGLTRGKVERYLRRGHQVVLDPPVQVAQRRQSRGPHPHDEVLIRHTVDGADHLRARRGGGRTRPKHTLNSTLWCLENKALPASLEPFGPARLYIHTRTRGPRQKKNILRSPGGIGGARNRQILW